MKKEVNQTEQKDSADGLYTSAAVKKEINAVYQDFKKGKGDYRTLRGVSLIANFMIRDAVAVRLYNKACGKESATNQYFSETEVK